MGQVLFIIGIIILIFIFIGGIIFEFWLYFYRKKLQEIFKLRE